VAGWSKQKKTAT